MEDDQVLSLTRPESLLTHLPGHLWRDIWTALSGPLSVCIKLVESLRQLSDPGQTEATADGGSTSVRGCCERGTPERATLRDAHAL